MTYRDNINSRIGAWAYVPIAAPLVFMAGLFALGPPDHQWSTKALFGLIILFAVVMLPTMLLVLFRLVCPKCDATLMPLVRYTNFPLLRVSKKARFCPVCGLDLDNEIESEQSPSGDELKPEPEE